MSFVALLIAFAALAVGGASAQTVLPRCIIGAGAAGLGAASGLPTDRPVILFEARERVGGRVFTDNSLGFSVDLGAGWIQGAYATNPLVSLLKENTSVQAVATSFETAGSYDLSTGAAVPPAKVAAVAQAFRSAQTAVYERQEALTPATDVPLSTLLDTVLQSANATVKNDVLWSASQAIANEYAVDLSWLSGKYYGAGAAERGESLIFRNGYINLFNGIVAPLDIRLNTPVSSVTKKADSVELQTSNGTVECYQVLVTVPLGTLKAELITFSPPLPADKIAAIKAMGYGLLDKIVLQFPKTTTLPAAIASQDVFYLYSPDVANEKRKFFEWLNYDRVVPGSNAVVGLISGSFAEAAENGTGVVEAALSAIQAAFPDFTAPPVADVKSKITRWRSDPWSRGSYSFIAPGADPTNYETLGKGIDGWLFFAGEHTNKTYPALVHGALGSGRRAAKDMVAQTPVVGPTATGTTGPTATATATAGPTTAVPTTSSKPSSALSLTPSVFCWTQVVSLIITFVFSVVLV